MDKSDTDKNVAIQKGRSRKMARNIAMKKLRHKYMIPFSALKLKKENPMAYDDYKVKRRQLQMKILAEYPMTSEEERTFDLWEETT